MSILGSISEKEVDAKDSLCISDSDDDPIDDQERLRRNVSYMNNNPAPSPETTDSNIDCFRKDNQPYLEQPQASNATSNNRCSSQDSQLEHDMQ